MFFFFFVFYLWIGGAIVVDVVELIVFSQRAEYKLSSGCKNNDWSTVVALHSWIDVGRYSVLRKFFDKYDVIVSDVITVCDTIIPIDAPLAFANGISIANINTPISVPLVAAFTNIDISITPENRLTKYAMAIHMNAYNTPSDLIYTNWRKSVHWLNTGNGDRKSSHVTVAIEFNVDTKML